MDCDIILEEEGDDMKNYDMLAHPNYRYIATAIDGVIIFIFTYPIMYYMNQLDNSVSFSFGFLLLIFLCRVVVYLVFDFVIPVWTKGQTIGRKILNLRVIQDDFTKANWKNFLKRSTIFIVIAFIAFVAEWTTVAYIIWLIVFVLSIVLLYNDSRRKTVHDYVGSTVIVYDKKYQESAE